MSLLKNTFQRIRFTLLPSRLQRREQIALAIGGAALGLFLVAQLIIFPPLNKRERLHQQITAQSLALAEMRLLAAEYAASRGNTSGSEAQLRNRPAGFTLFSFLDALAGQSGIKSNIVYMRPSTSNIRGGAHTLSMVELRIDALTMQQLVTFMHGVETSPNMIWIRRISLSRGDREEDLINAILQVETIQS